MLIKNAQNTVEQSKMVAGMAANSSIKVETLRETWQTIVTASTKYRLYRIRRAQSALKIPRRLRQSRTTTRSA